MNCLRLLQFYSFVYIYSGFFETCEINEMKVKMSGGPASLQLKIILLVFGLLIAAGTLIYTQSLVNDLQIRERETAQLIASSFESVAGKATKGGDFSFELGIIRKINFPLILAPVDINGNIRDSIIAYRNFELDSSLSAKQVKQYTVINLL